MNRHFILKNLWNLLRHSCWTLYAVIDQKKLIFRNAKCNSTHEWESQLNLLHTNFIQFFSALLDTKLVELRNYIKKRSHRNIFVHDRPMMM